MRPKPIVGVDLAGTPVEGEEQPAAGVEDPRHLAERRRRRRALEMDDGVKGGDPRQRAVGETERPEVAHCETQGRAEAAGDRHHSRRQVQPEGVDPALGQVARDLTRPAAEVADETAAAHGSGEAVQPIPVERFPRQLVEELLGVRLGDPIVGGGERRVPVARGHVVTSLGGLGIP